MLTVQIVLDEKLLRATDQAARRTRRNRSALVRDALREHLRGLEVRTREERDRDGYSKQPHARHCAQVLLGIDKCLYRSTYLPVLVDIQNSRARFRKYIATLFKRRIEGVIAVQASAATFLPAKKR